MFNQPLKLSKEESLKRKQEDYKINLFEAYQK